MKFCSEYGEDRWVFENVKLPEKSFYVDLGCAWPHLYSNTAFLRELGWSGLNIDGNASYAPSWEGVAPFTNCVIGDGGKVQFAEEGVPELSRIVPTGGVAMLTRRLDEMLKDASNVDFVSSDLEGAEFDALKTFPWDKQRPRVIVSEYNTYGIGEDFRVKEMLEAMGYVERHRTIANIIFTL